MSTNGMSLESRAQALPGRDAWLSISAVKNTCALTFLATSVAPALYLPPVMLVLMLALSMIEILFLKVPNGRAPYVRPLMALLAVMFLSALASGLGPGDILSYEA